MNGRNDVSVLSASDLADALAFDLVLLGRQVDGLTHADSLLQPRPRGNCLNWVLGHLVVHRDLMLQVLGQDPEFAEGVMDRYARGSAPITVDGPDVRDKDDLLAALERQQGRLADALTTASADALMAPSPLNPDRTVGGQVHFLYWHETLHIGTTELLRQLAGTDDQVI